LRPCHEIFLGMPSDPYYFATYPALVARLRERLGDQSGFEAAVGGDFFTVGNLEFELLRSVGLPENATVVDVGCGSGRLAAQLAGMNKIRYVGTDIVPELLDYARKLAGRSDWLFHQTAGAQIPCPDGTADLVCFFSVFTHLTHEDSFRYLRETKRVLKPGGKVVISFLEFCIYSHWAIFDLSVNSSHPGDHLNQFMDRDGIRAWAHHLGLTVESIFDGDKAHIPIRQDLAWSDGRVMRNLGALGQSVAVLVKP